VGRTFQTEGTACVKNLKGKRLAQSKDRNKTKWLWSRRGGVWEGTRGQLGSELGA
jgi:hypothetical protein